jgi:hypothetical protein
MTWNLMAILLPLPPTNKGHITILAYTGLFKMDFIILAATRQTIIAIAFKLIPCKG